MRNIMISTLLIASALGRVPAYGQDTIFFPPPNRIAIRDMRSLPARRVGNALRVYTVVGATGSASLAEFDSGSTTGPVHHHTREQVDVGLTGTLESTLDTHAEQFPPGHAAVIPAEVSHSFSNPRAGLVTALEFHTVRRPDLPPGYPAMRFPYAPEPVSLPDNARLVKRVDAGAGETLDGRTCTVRWRWVSAPVDVHPTTTSTELFVYVARGDAELTAEGRTSRVKEGSLIIIPAELARAKIAPVNTSKAALVEFQVREPAERSP